MNNLVLPAYPVPGAFALDESGNLTVPLNGFTKLELASLMMVPVVATYKSFLEMSDETVAENAVSLAKIVLEKSNK
jgi:hypothetical protein